MRSIKFLKIFWLIVICTSACRFWQPKTDANAAPPTPIAIEEIKSEIPFATKEPEIYQTEIVVTANGVENTTATARNGANRLTTYDYGKRTEFALLQTGAGASFLIARRQKIYTENQTAETVETDDNFPTVELLNQKRAANYESLGAENGLAKYLVRLADAKNSEIVITIDANINLPVKQEFYSITGEQKILVSTTELKNFRRQTDAQNFELPKDYKKVSPTEFQEILRRERMK